MRPKRELSADFIGSPKPHASLAIFSDLLIEVSLARNMSTPDPDDLLARKKDEVPTELQPDPISAATFQTA